MFRFPADFAFEGLNDNELEINFVSVVQIDLVNRSVIFLIVTHVLSRQT